MGSITEYKWQLFLRRVWPFQYIPFIDFVFAAGSLATGAMHEGSDFDVILGVRQGRIFTVRALCILFFGLLGWRRKKSDKQHETSDTICLNHFVTPRAYRLQEPHNTYWQMLYRSLVPVYGVEAVFQSFWDVNSDWLGIKKRYIADPRHIYKKHGTLQRCIEFILTGWLGNCVESIMRSVQMNRIQKGLRAIQGYKPRIICNDNELEFHPDTKRIADFIKEH
ncbi:MAG: hypothetical protein Q8R26_02580 [bacterium]|nr:hypothetical protein [bacterium]